LISDIFGMLYFLEALSHNTFLIDLIMFSTWYRRNWIDLWWFVKTSMRDQSSNRNLELWMIWFPVLMKRFKTALRCCRFLLTNWRLPLAFQTTILPRKIRYLSSVAKENWCKTWFNYFWNTKANILYSCHLNADASRFIDKFVVF